MPLHTLWQTVRLDSEMPNTIVCLVFVANSDIFLSPNHRTVLFDTSSSVLTVSYGLRTEGVLGIVWYRLVVWATLR